MNTRSRKLVDQQHALDDFFESLMRDVQAYAEQDSEQTDVATAALPVRQSVDTPASAVTLLDVPLKTPILPLPPVAEPIPVPISTEPVTQTIAQPEPAVPVEAHDETPTWAHAAFQALLFKVAGLTLAVPLIDLNGVVEWSADAVTEMPGHADFYLGLMPHLDKNVALIDTARMVLPGDRLLALQGEDPANRIHRIVLIDDGRYGLACDDVAEVVTLQSQDVRWRTSRTQRRWLAGTVIGHMCALIDATAFARMLADRLPVQAFRQ